MFTKIKVCGTTNVFDAHKTAEFDVDYLGIVVDVPFSERSISVAKAKEISEAVSSSIDVVALFFDQSVEWMVDAIAKIGPFAVQLLGNEPPSIVKKLRETISSSTKIGLNCQVWKTVFFPETQTSEVLGNLESYKASIEGYIDAGVDAILLDTADLSEGRFGGTGKTGNWTIARELIKSYESPIFLAGGINPHNVAEAIQTTGPYGIDLCSGVEKYKGKRDFCKLRQLVESLSEISNRFN